MLDDFNAAMGERPQIRRLLAFLLFLIPAILIFMAPSLSFFSCMLVVFVIFGALMGLALLTKYKLGQLLEKPRIRPSQDFVRRRESFTVDYRQGVKKQVAVLNFMATFVLRESATYRRGTDTVTETHDNVLGTFTAEQQFYQPGDEIAHTMAFEVPFDAIHTFAAKNNKLTYLVLTDVELPTWPHHYKEQLELIVEGGES